MNFLRYSFAITLVSVVACADDSLRVQRFNTTGQGTQKDSVVTSNILYTALPLRSNPRPETTDNIPHIQLGVELVPEVHEELVRRTYAIPGVEDLPSLIASWQGLWLHDSLTIEAPNAIIGGREFGHIHDDGSLHIFLEPLRANQAVEAGWAIHHPFAVQNQEGWDGFVMLYTPLDFQELDVTLQLIVDGYNYVTGQGG